MAFKSKDELIDVLIDATCISPAFRDMAKVNANVLTRERIMEKINEAKARKSAANAWLNEYYRE